METISHHKERWRCSDELVRAMRLFRTGIYSKIRKAYGYLNLTMTKV